MLCSAAAGVVTAAAKKPTGEFVCTGHVVLTSGKLGVAVRLLNTEGQNPIFAEKEDRVYSGKRMVFLRPGAVYKMEYEGSSVMAGTVEYLRPWSDQDAAAEWEARSAQAKGQVAAEAAEKKLADVHHLVKLLAPIRKQYRSTNYTGQVAIELLVLRALRFEV